MAKYLILWETDRSRLPADPKETVAVLMKLTEGTKQAMKIGQLSDWGVYPSGFKGYVIAEGKAQDLNKMSLLFYPYITFTAQEVLTIDEGEKVLKSMMP